MSAEALVRQFFAPAGPEEVCAAAAELRERGAPVRSTAFLHPRSGRPVRGGLWSPSLFGRGADERCGVVAVGQVVHPALVPAIAAVLGLSEAVVRAVARCGTMLRDGRTYSSTEWWAAFPEDSDTEHTGVHALASALAACEGPAASRLAARGIRPVDLLVSVVPVPPPRLRPLITNEAGQRLPGPDNQAYAALVEAAGGLAFYGELAAPSILATHAQACVQGAFEALCERLAAPASEAASDDPIPFADITECLSRFCGRPVSADELRRPQGTPRAFTLECDERAAAWRPWRAAFTGDGEALVQCRHAALRLRFAGDGAEIVGVVATPDVALFGCVDGTALFRRAGSYDGTFLPDLYALDVATRRWLGAWPEGLPPPLPSCPHEYKRLLVVDLRRGRQRDFSPYRMGDIVASPELSPDLRLCRVGGELYEVETGLLRFLSEPLIGRRRRDEDEGDAMAFVLAGGGWRIAWQDRVFAGTAARFGLDGLVPLAFDGAGRQLLAGDESRLARIELDADGRLVARVDHELGPLRALLGLDELAAAAAMTEAQVGALCVAFGSLAGVREASAAAIRGLSTSRWDAPTSRWQETCFFTPAQAEEVVARAAECASTRWLRRAVPASSRVV